MSSKQNDSTADEAVLQADDTFTALSRQNRKRKYCIAGIAISVAGVAIILVCVLCFADVTLTLRCEIADDLDITSSECPEDTLESLQKSVGAACSRQNFTISNHTHNRNDDYLELAASSWDTAWEILHHTQGWHLEKGKTLETGRVYSKVYRGFGRVSKIEAYVDCSPEQLFKILVTDAELLPQWDSLVEETQLIENVTENIDICYTMTPSLGGGLISQRDYVILRHWKKKDNMTMCSVCSTTHPDKPPIHGLIRGIYRPSGVLFRPVPGNLNRCILQWVISADLKGWIPQWALATREASLLMDMLHNCRKRVEFLKKHDNIVPLI